MPMSRWSPVSPVALGAFLVGTALLGLAVRATGGFVPVLDHANLAFHEAGHLVYGIFGRTAELYGGTLGQLTLPVVAIVAFAWRGSTLGVAVAGVWLFENFFNIARYAADARAAPAARRRRRARLGEHPPPLAGARRRPARRQGPQGARGAGVARRRRLA